MPQPAVRDHGWERRWLAPRDGSLKLHVALRQEDGGVNVERQLSSLSDPKSPSSRQYLGSGEISYLLTPAQGTVHAVELGIWERGLLQDSTLFNGAFEIDTTIRSVEKLLNTTYSIYSDATQNAIRTELYYLPDPVVEHIDFITPTSVSPKAVNPAVPGRASKGKVSGAVGSTSITSK